MPGKVDLEGGSVPRLAGDIDEAIVLLDDAIDGSKPQADALSDLLGREERLEDMRLRFLVHAAAVVADGEPHIVAGARAIANGATGTVQRRVSRLDGQVADAGDRVPGVDAQASEDLVNLGRVDLD